MHKSSHTIAAVAAAAASCWAIRPSRSAIEGSPSRWIGRAASRMSECGRWRTVAMSRAPSERFLLVHGERVVRVATTLMAGERRGGRDRGKSDLIDAMAVGRAALRRASIGYRSPSWPALSSTFGPEVVQALAPPNTSLDAPSLAHRRTRLMAHPTAATAEHPASPGVCGRGFLAARPVDRAWRSRQRQPRGNARRRPCSRASGGRTAGQRPVVCVPRSSERPESRRDHWAVGRPLVRNGLLPASHFRGHPAGESSHASWRP
jgi:hypothetical protein